MLNISVRKQESHNFDETIIFRTISILASWFPVARDLGIQLTTFRKYVCPLHLWLLADLITSVWRPFSPLDSTAFNAARWKHIKTIKCR